jgi:sugar/nucleoside kinase (ribokinase family)
VKKSGSGCRVVIVGSVALDSIRTPSRSRRDLLGGSCSYACAASALFAPTGMVGVVGTDFPRRHVSLYRRLGIDVRGLETVPGRTFRWSGVYEDDLIHRRTLKTELNVFERFAPELPEAYRDAPFLLLGNIQPGLQEHVLDGARRPRFVLADTMDLWIRTCPDALRRVVRRVDMLTLNDTEARLLTGLHNLRDCAARLLKWGPRWVVIKKGEHGAALFSRAGIFLVPAYPVRRVVDPTGAGDSFAGAFMGRLSQAGGVTEAGVREALLHGAVVASFGVEAFGLEGLAKARAADVRRRLAELRRMTAAN